MTAARLHAFRSAPLGRPELDLREVQLVKHIRRSDVLVTGPFLARVAASAPAQRLWSQFAGEDVRVAGARSENVAPPR